MPTYLITGIAGFIGSALARAVLERGGRVRGLDNFSTGKRENISEILGRVDFRELDLADASALGNVCEGVDYVLHQAAIPSVPRSVADPVTTHMANVNGTLNLLLAARDAKVKRVIFASSSSIYGDTPTLPKHERMLPDPISPYAVSKLSGEMYMKSFYRVYGLETVSLRYFNIFGPRQDPASQYSGVLALFIPKMLRGEQPTIHGDGEQTRDFTFVANAVEANLLACTAPADKVAGRAFNVATGSRVSLNQTFEMLKKLTGYTREAIHGPDRTGDIKHSLADVSLAEAAFGYKPLVDFQEGLRQTVAWYRGNVILASAG